MYSAFVKELVGRLPALSSLDALSAQLAQMGCPASRLAQQAARIANPNPNPNPNPDPQP